MLKFNDPNVGLQKNKTANATQRRYKRGNNKNKKRNHDIKNKCTMLIMFYFIIGVTIIQVCSH